MTLTNDELILQANIVCVFKAWSFLCTFSFSCSSYDQQLSRSLCLSVHKNSPLFGEKLAEPPTYVSWCYLIQK